MCRIQLSSFALFTTRQIYKNSNRTNAVHNEGDHKTRTCILMCMRMLTYKYGDGMCTYYLMALQCEDCNFTKSSFWQVPCTLKRPQVLEKNILFTMPPHNGFFEAFLHRKSKYTSLIPFTTKNPIPIPLSERPMTLLLKKLYLQLDNNAKVNKNRFIMVLYLLFIAK